MKELRLFCPAEDYKWSQSIKTERELQIVKDIAYRLVLPIKLDAATGKLFLGRKTKGGEAQAVTTDMRAKVRPQAQHTSKSCGQTSVAMAINSRTNGDWTDYDVAARYGYELFGALTDECPGIYKDWGNMPVHTNLWETAIRPSLAKGVPVVIGLNGQFSASGSGHIVLIVALVGADQVVYADPATGQFRTTTRSAMEDCPPHPDGKFVFAAA